MSAYHRSNRAGFDTREEAEGLLTAMRGVWARVTGSLISDPAAQIVESVETKTY